MNKDTEEEILCQCAEECAELAQACLKMRRVIKGTTPVTAETAAKNIAEETGDVLNCIDVMEKNHMVTIDYEQRREKLKRWAERMKEWKAKEEALLLKILNAPSGEDYDAEFWGDEIPASCSDCTYFSNAACFAPPGYGCKGEF